MCWSEEEEREFSTLLYPRKSNQSCWREPPAPSFLDHGNTRPAFAFQPTHDIFHSWKFNAGAGRRRAAQLSTMSSIEEVRAAEPNQIFRGLKFWVAQRCPTRSAFVEVIEYLGGEIVPLDKQADHLIVDHLRKDNPPRSISYQWIEKSYKSGKKEPLDDYLQGPLAGTTWATGSVRPTKSSRTPFTAEDDKYLWNWVQENETRGGRVLGNEIYKDLERHVSNG